MRVLLIFPVLLLLAQEPAWPSQNVAQPVDKELKELLVKSPSSFDEEQALCKSALDLGAEAIIQVCRMIDGQGDDDRPRTLLQSIAMFAGKGATQEQRQTFVRAVAESLSSSPNEPVNAFLIQLLQEAGGDESVDVLSKFITDKRLCDPAVRALTAIGTPAAVKSLTTALSDNQAADSNVVVLALGELRAAQATEAISLFTESGSTPLRQNALWALANIGYEPAADRLKAEFENSQGLAKAAAGSNWLLLAQRMAQNGQPEKAASICRTILSIPADEALTQMQCAALATLAEAAGPQAAGDLLAAADSHDLQLAAAAVALANRVKEPGNTKQWIEKLHTSQPPVAELIADMLGRRGDRAATPALVGLFYHANDDLAIAAFEAAVQLDEQEAAAAILDRLRKPMDQPRLAAAVELLMRLPDEKVLTAASGSLSAMPAENRIRLMQGLGQRRASACSKDILAQIADPNPQISQAAIQAMKGCAAAADMERVLTLMLQAQDQSQRSVLRQAVITAAGNNPDVKNRSDLILQRLAESSNGDKPMLLSILPATGGAKALDVIVASVTDADPAVKDAAIRALADWQGDTAVPALMKIVVAEELRYKVLALRGTLKILQDSSLTQKRKVTIAQQAMEAVERPEEKQLILAFLSEMHTLGALQLAAGCMQDDRLRSQAARAVAHIALPGDTDAGLVGVMASRILAQSAPLLTDLQLRSQVESYLAALPSPVPPARKTAPQGFTPLFNGKDLSGWRGVLLPPNDNPITRELLSQEERAELQAKADDHMRAHWSVEDGVLFFDGKGFSIAPLDDYEDFELYLDWKIDPHGDSGVYLRGSPQVQIWDPADWPVGSGGLYNNQKNPSKPLVRADKPIGQWNTFHITMVDQRVTVLLNDILVVDNILLENYWDRSLPIFRSGPIELQCHGDPIWFANIFVRRIPRQNNWVSLFNGTDLSGWAGEDGDSTVEGDALVWHGSGKLYTENQYDNFHLKCEFRLTPGANNGIGIRAPLQGDAAYAGLEIQILDDTAQCYAGLKPYQYCGSIYGVVPAKTGHLKPVGEWNGMEIIAVDRQIKVILNDAVIVDADLAAISEKKTMDAQPHPGLNNTKGHIVLLGHETEVAFRNMQISEL